MIRNRSGSAPYGLSDMFSLTVRPNPVLATRDVCQAKTARLEAGLIRARIRALGRPLD